MLKKMSPIIFLVFLSIISCSFHSPDYEDYLTNQYSLEIIPSSLPNSETHPHVVLQVNKTQALPLYQTKHIFYRENFSELGYFINNYWQENPQQLFYSLLLKTLSAAFTLNTKIHPPNYIVNTTIREFEQDFRSKPSKFLMTLQIQIINASTHKEVVNRAIRRIIGTPTDNAYGGVLAANIATSEVLEEIRRGCLALPIV